MAATTLLFDGIKAAANITDRVLVFYSGGKDSAVTLDLCARYFKRIQPVFMRLGPILSFQRACLDWVERRYRVPVMIVPHPMLVDWLRYARSKSGVWWIAAGERIADSIVRRAMIKGDGGVVNPKRGRFSPSRTGASRTCTPTSGITG